SIAAYLSFIGHIRQSRSLSRKHLLAYHSVVGKVHGKFQHLNRGRRFCKNFLCPFISCVFKLIMWYYGIHHPHIKGFLCSIFPSEEKYFLGFFLAHHFSQISTSIASVKTGNICIGLFKDRMFFTCKGNVAYHMQAMTTPYCPTRNNSNYSFRHKSDESLHFKDIKPVHSIFPYTTRMAAGLLLAATTRRI